MKAKYVVIDGSTQIIYITATKKAAERVQKYCQRASNLSIQMGNVGLYPISELHINEWLLCKIVVVTKTALKNYI